MRELGVLFVPSSGRPYQSIMSNFADIDQSLLEGSYVISYNGGFINRYGVDTPLLSTVMDRKTPYVEVIAGIHNIFKVFHIEYVRRLTYLERPGTDKWGIRFMFRVTF